MTVFGGEGGFGETIRYNRGGREGVSKKMNEYKKVEIQGEDITNGV